MLDKCTIPINTLERTLGIDIESAEADTLPGLVMWKLAELPKEAQFVDFDQFSIVINKMGVPRIFLLRIHPKMNHKT